MPNKEDQIDDTTARGVAEVSYNAEGEVEVPVHAVPDAASANIIYDEMRKSHGKRAYNYARIQGMLDGNPPYPKKSMQRTGLEASSNVNWRDGEAVYESVALAYWSLFNEVEHIARFTTNIGDPNSNPETGDIVSEEWDRIVRRWDKFSTLMSQHQGDLIKFGSSFLVWTDERDWRFDVADVWRTLIPERSRNHVDFLNIVAIEHIMTAQELWNVYENSEGGKWDKETLARILTFYANYNSDDREYSGQYFAELQRMVRNGDTSIEELYNSDILMVSMFVREFDGKISRGIFHSKFEGGTDDWAFFEDRQYEEMGEALQLFTFTPGEQFVHGNKGVGHRIYNVIEGITQMDNSAMDSARRSTTVLVSTGASRGRDSKQLLFNYGGMTDIGEAKFVQNLMGSNTLPVIEAARYFRFKLETNNNISGTSMSNPDGKPRTFGEVRAQVTKEAKVQKNRIAHYYNQLDVLFRQMVRKMLQSKDGDPGYEMVRLWKERCIARNVPAEFFALTEENKGEDGLPGHMEVFAVRASGSGSQVADQIEMQTIMQVLPTLGERGRRAAMQDFIAAHRGHDYIDRYLPPEDQTQQPTGEDTIASIENNQLEKGEMVVVSPDNNHAIHAPRHMNRMQQIAQAFNEAESQARQTGAEQPQVDAGNFGQYSLEDTDVAFQTLGPHFVRHLLYLQQDPTRKELAQSLGAQWAILANFGDKIANNAQEHRTKKLRDMQKQEQELENLDSEERVKMRELEVDANIKMQKLIADIDRAAARDQLQYLVERQKVSLKHEVDKLKAAAEISMKAQNAQQETTGKSSTELF